MDVACEPSATTLIAVPADSYICSGSQSKTVRTAIKPIFDHRSVLRLRSPWGAWVFLPCMYGDGIPDSNIPGCRY
jgi:hypothetical protein